MDKNFKKRYFHKLSDFFALGKKIFAAKKKTKGIRDEDKISRAFAEKIMLAVTGVNNCVYCSYRHTKTALEQGVSEDEINNLLNGEFGNVPQEEQVALLYAQHWTESNGNPDNNARAKMIDQYGQKKTAFTELYLNIINAGNLISNTVEAYKEKIRPETGKVSFFFTYLLCAPIAFFIRTDGRKHRSVIEGKVGFLK